MSIQAPVTDVLNRLRRIEGLGENQLPENVMFAYELCMRVEALLPEVAPVMDEWTENETATGSYVATLLAAADEALEARESYLAHS